MAASTPAVRRQLIDQATRAARESTIRRREQRARVIEAAYDQLADGAVDWLQQHANSDGRVPPEALGAFDVYIEALLRRVQQEVAQALAEGMPEAALAAVAVFDATSTDRIVQATLRQLRDFVAADGLQLSDRVWRVDTATRRRVVDTIRNAILRGDSAWQSARELLAAGHATTPNLALGVRAAQPAVLGAQVRAELTTAAGNPLRNALRVLRTEINRAFTEGFVAATYEQHDIAAVKFNLSPLHPRPDICDLYAHANLHGLGPGVYPRGAHPYPAHPETLSYLTVVFVDEITEADRAARESPLDWLRKRDDATQAAVLGVHKAAALRAGQLHADDLQTAWRDIKTRIGDPTP